MNHLAPTGADPVPLNFNAPVRTEWVADALAPEPAVAEVPPPDTESLLEQLGLPALTVKEILTASASARAF